MGLTRENNNSDEKESLVTEYQPLRRKGRKKVRRQSH
jgi:hypothetical protein